MEENKWTFSFPGLRKPLLFWGGSGSPQTACLLYFQASEDEMHQLEHPAVFSRAWNYSSLVADADVFDSGESPRDSYPVFSVMNIKK